ncbi:hypothetical protein V8B55DRAFT_1465376 [Mucor lusitanicus]|uniref:YncI copper-binding domain-containing protein n=2 Tax=Mucor circinelloides f. lusitanicus TaxID=29924 RepID=A0A168JKI3_MUCCL|nr:hypothetical protein FB192DRAFT_1355550 [Mucor lusitanicus]OAD01312.1 hypothetical protein MUCCIDRAFT_156766 [Mucor lusitanicus CBS 277.49]
MAILRNSLIAAALTLLFSASAQAHVALNPKFAEPGQNLTTAFHVPHGCNGSATTGITVTVPDAITVLTPQQVNNWTLTTTYRDESNTTVSTITWNNGYLDPKGAADFPMTLSLPNSDLSSQPNVTLYFPVVQTCQVGTANWTAFGNDHEGEPAPTIVIVKNATQAAADAIAIKTNATASASASASASSAAATQTGSAANSIYAGVLPFAAAIGALAVAL